MKHIPDLSSCWFLCALVIVCCSTLIMFEVMDFLVGFAFGFLIYISLQKFGNTLKRAPLPPGPKGLPLVGNLNDLPPPGVFEAHHWLRLKDIYGTTSSDMDYTASHLLTTARTYQLYHGNGSDNHHHKQLETCITTAK